MGVLESYVLKEIDGDIESVATQAVQLYKRLNPLKHWYWIYLYPMIQLFCFRYKSILIL